MISVTPGRSQALFGIAASRELERRALSALPAHTLMRRAGLAVARLALAVAPHAGHIWIACGPGNNGGDGFEAGLRLHALGKKVTLTWTQAARTGSAPADASAARASALAAGLEIASEPPPDFDLGVDALLGLGGWLDPARQGSALMADWLSQMHRSGKPLVCVDLPTGLAADTGLSSWAEVAPSGARIHTLSLLTLKPGLFTADGRDRAGRIWFDDLGVPADPDITPDAYLLGADQVITAKRWLASHSSHKGSFGDVAVIGGMQARGPDDTSMAGAALLAARAALHGGAGRVYVALLGEPHTSLDPLQPELMFRSPATLDLHQTVVCGCGGGQTVRGVLPAVLTGATRAVLDADALNALAADTGLQALLRARRDHNLPTILTPHPLEAARLLGLSARQVQANRLDAAGQLADRLGCVVVLKGSGTVIAESGRAPVINSTGNALLATAGTGDVLAGLTGARLAAGLTAWDAACSAVFRHGEIADRWREATAPGASQALTASKLAERI